MKKNPNIGTPFKAISSCVFGWGPEEITSESD
jgi:hypothetical protein